MLKQCQKNNEQGDSLLRTDFSKKFQSVKPQTNVSSRQPFRETKDSKPQSRVAKTEFKNKSVYKDTEMLDFGGLKSLGDKMSRIIWK